MLFFLEFIAVNETLENKRYLSIIVVVLSEMNMFYDISIDKMNGET